MARRRRDGCGAVQVSDPVLPLPRRRKPSPAGKVAGPKALTDEGTYPLLGEGGPTKPGRVWGGTRSDPVPPLPRRRKPPPSPAWRGCRPQAAGVEGTPDRIKPSLVEWERLFSLIRHALRRATLSVGEGDLRRGRPYGRDWPARTYRFCGRTFRGDVGIAPYEKGRTLPHTHARP